MIKYVRYVALGLAGGLLISVLAFFIMGRNFGFENVTPRTLVPAFIVGCSLAAVVIFLVLRGHLHLRMRMDLEQQLSSELKTEIGRRSQAEIILQQAQESHRLVTESVPTGIIVHSGGTIVFANPAAVEMFGAASERGMLGMDALDLVHMEGQEEVLAKRHDRVSQGKYTGSLHLRRVRLDGSLFWSEGHARDIVFGGQPSTLVMIQDVSAQVVTEDALEVSRARFQDFAEASADWFWETDAELRYNYLSDSVERIVGAPPQWHYGKSRKDLLGADYDRDMWDAHIADLEARRPFRNFEFLRPGDEAVKSIWIRTNGAPIWDANGAFLGYRGSATDITAQKLAEQKLRESEELLARAEKLKSVGQLTGGIAHDFNNLLAVIQGNAEILGDQTGPNNAQTQTILRATKRGAELTQRLLAFSRQQPLQPRVVDMGALITGMIELLRRALGETIEIDMHIPDALRPVMADPGQVENALLNLAINARDAMPRGGRLAIACQNVELDEAYVANHPDASVGHFVVFSVGDTGSGMSPDVLEQAFDPFFTTKDVGEGSGLGLSMVYGFARQSGGHVAIDSVTDEGTTVSVYLPQAEEQIAQVALATSDSVPSGNGETILVIEDDADVCALVVRMLSDLGYETEEASDAATAGELLADGTTPDLVISDVVLPGARSGPQFAAHVRAEHPDIRFLFMSGYPEDVSKRDELLDSDSRLLSKPFARDDLARAVNAALGS